jgi:hypothetical protein
LGVPEEVLKEKFIVLNAYIRNEESLKPKFLPYETKK